MSKEQRIGVVIAILGLVVAILALFRDVFNVTIRLPAAAPTNEVNSATRIPVSPESEAPSAVLIPTATEASELTRTPYTQTIESDIPGVTIRVTDRESRPSTGFVILHLFAADRAMTTYALYTGEVIKDIAGNWQDSRKVGGPIWQEDDGSYKQELPEGYWGVYYGNGTVNCWGKWEYPYPIFQTFTGKTTEVDIRFGVLEVGLLDNKGRAKTNTEIDIGIEQKDAAGSPIFGGCHPLGSSSQTDQTGIARFVVVEGTYAVRYNLGFGEYGDWQRNISVEASKVKRIILKTK